MSFRPSEAPFRDVLRTTLAQVDGLVVVDNSPDASEQERVRRLVEENSGSSGGLLPTLITSGENIGLSRAINRGILRSVETGFSLFLLLDQDSTLQPGAVTVLKEEYERRAPVEPAFILAAENAIPNPSVVHRLLDSVFYRYGSSSRESHSSPMAITSGMLVDARVLRRVGLFDESLFLDSTDHEFCLRARKAGTRIYVVPRAGIQHELGETTPQRSKLLGVELRYRSQDRLYFGTRDTLRTVRRYWATHPLLCATLVGFTVARLGAYWVGGSEHQPQFAAARRGWVDFLIERDRPRIPALPAE